MERDIYIADAGLRRKKVTRNIVGGIFRETGIDGE